MSLPCTPAHFSLKLNQYPKSSWEWGGHEHHLRLRGQLWGRGLCDEDTNFSPRAMPGSDNEDDNDCKGDRPMRDARGQRWAGRHRPEREQSRAARSLPMEQFKPLSFSISGIIFQSKALADLQHWHISKQHFQQDLNPCSVTDFFNNFFPSKFNFDFFIQIS